MALQALKEIIVEFTIINKKKSHYINRKLILKFRESSLTYLLDTSVTLV